MSRLEAKINAEVKNYLSTLPQCWFYKTTDRFVVGVPDILVCYKGYFIALELKSDTGKPTPHQMDKLLKIILAGGRSAIIRDLEEVKAIIKAIDNL